MIGIRWGSPRSWPALVALLAGLWLIQVPANAAPVTAAGTTATSAVTAGLPSGNELEARIKEAESSTRLDEANRKAVIDAYRRLASLIESARTFRAKAEEFGAALTGAPDQTAAIRKRLDTPVPPLPSDEDLGKLSDEALSGQLAKVRGEIAATETRLGNLEHGLAGNGTRASEAQTRLAEARLALDDGGSGPAVPVPADQPPELTQALAWVQAARHQALDAEILALERELASQTARSELARAQEEDLGRSLESLQERQTQLRNEQDRRRKSEAEQAKRETEAARQAAADKHSLVQQIANENAELTETLAQLTGQIERFNEQLTQIERDRKRIEDDFRGARERIEVACINQTLGQVLIDRRKDLPDLRRVRKDIAKRNDAIAQAALDQIHFREIQRPLRDLDASIEDLTATEPEAQTEAVRGELRGLLQARRDLVEKAQAANTQFIRKQEEINNAAQRLIQSGTDYNRFLDKHLLWVRSAGSVSLDTLRGLPPTLSWLLAPTAWGEVREVLTFELGHSAATWLGLLIAGLLAWKKSHLKTAIIAAGQPLRRARTDDFNYTLKAVGLTLLVALPLPLACLLLGRELAGSIEATPFTRALGQALGRIALGLYFLRLFHFTCLPGGVADRHFRWHPDVLTRIRRHLAWFTPFSILSGLIAYIAFLSPDTSHNESLGRLALVTITCGSAVFLSQLLNPTRGVVARYLAEHPSGWANRLRNLWYFTLVGAPLALGGLAILGYLYTAGTLFESLSQSVWLVLGLTLLQQLIVRWLVYTRRLLALQAALERQATRRAQADAQAAREDAIQEGGEEPPPVEEPAVDLASLDEQTRKLLNASIVLLAALGLWLIWSPMLPALGVFEQLTLWQTTRTVGGVTQVVPTTAADLGLVLVTLFIALVAAKNLPALIEILLLRRTDVAAGTRYTVRTLVSYGITAAALLLIFGTLGMQWSQVQWLVAALSVGIGFGLQEIVANFISGLIVLLERPVRVGDVVTIGTTTGTVTKIEIRATTIRNSDRQELIVPNKEFITGRLLNWTLTDSVNRILVTLNVVPGSDPRLALELMLGVANADPRILKDPPPQASLDAFGERSLTLVLACFLGTMDGRTLIATDLRLGVERAFRECGIELA